MTGAQVDTNLTAAKIKGGLLWFLYLSVYKEAETCFSAKAADCDSSWAYYAGGDLDPATGNMLGFAKMVQSLSAEAHQAIIDGILAVRCVRDLYPSDTYPSLESLPAEGKALFDSAHEQLDNALHRAFAIIVRQHLQAGATCSDSFAANWAFLQIVGPVLTREANDRNPTAAAELAGIWQQTQVDAAVYLRAVQLLDEVFPCSSSI